MIIQILNVEYFNRLTMYKNESKDEIYPKTLIVRNHLGGGVWQVYHIQAEHEAKILSDNASGNGFEAITLEDHKPDLKETWPEWRETEGGKRIMNSH